MFTHKGIIYADAGKILVSNKFIGYCIKEDSHLKYNIKEEDVNIDDMILDGEYIKYFNNRILQINRIGYNYSDWKTYIIHWRYSNDDQIAILLNKDCSKEDEEKYIKMQEWREYAAKLARKIVNVVNS